MLTTEALYEEIDRVLSDLRIDFVIGGELRGFSYQDVPVAVGALTDESGPFVAVGAMALCEVQTDRDGIMAEIAASLDRLRLDRPHLTVKFIDTDKKVWVLRFIEPEDFTVETLLLEVGEVTTLVPEIGRELRERLATGVLGSETTFLLREASVARELPGRRQISSELFVRWLNWKLNPAPVDSVPEPSTRWEANAAADVGSEDFDEDIREARRSLGLE